MDHGQHNMQPASCKMHMLFTWDTQDLCVVFRWWHVRGPWSLLFTLLGVVALGMLYELLRNLARRFDECNSSVKLGPSNGDTADPEYDRGRRSPGISGRSNRRRHIIRSMLYGLQVFYSYLLMLVAMTYQGHVLIAIGIGAMLGFYLFHDDKTASSRNLACH